MSQGEFNVDLRLPPGTPLEQTDRVGAGRAAGERGARQRRPRLLRRRHRQPARRQPGRRRREHRPRSASRCRRARAAPTRRSRDGRHAQQTSTDLPGVQYRFSRPALFSMSTPLEVVVSGYDLDRLQRRRRAGPRGDARGRPLRRRQDDGRGRQSRDPDRVRPGARVAARPRGARHRRPRRQQRARRGRDALQAARQADRRAGAQRGHARRLDRGSPQPDRQSGRRAPGAAERGGRRAARRRPGRGAPRRPGARRGGLGQPRARRPRLGRRGAAAASSPSVAAAGRHDRVPVGPERGDDGLVPLAAVRAAARDLPRLPGDGLAVRVADPPVRDPAHHPARADRRGLGAVAHRHDASTSWPTSA